MKQAYVIPGILSVISCVWLYMAITVYGFWDEGPRGGFMPSLAALITLGFSLAAIVKASNIVKPWHMTIFIPAGLAVAVILATPLFGMLPGMFVMLLFWVRFLEKYSWKFSLTLAAGVILCVWLIFSLWLSVPFPLGWLGDTLLY